MFRSCSPTVRRVGAAGCLLVGAFWLGRVPDAARGSVAHSSARTAHEPLHEHGQAGPSAPSPRAAEPALPSLAGVVRDGANAAVEGALVCAARSRLMVAEPHVACTVSDAEGHFALHALPVGRTLLSASAGARGARGQRDDEARTLLRGQHVADLTLRLDTPTVELRGVVRDAAGGVLAGALVAGTSTEGALVAAETYSDDDGSFRLWLPRGSTALRATADGYARGELRVITPRAHTELLLEPAGSVRGRVVWARDGRPANDVSVHATGERGEQLTATSGPSGEFRLFGLRAGAYHLDAKEAHATSAVDQHVELEVAGEVHGVVLEVEPAAELRGQVLTRDGQPCIPGRVALLGAPDPTLDPAPGAAPAELAPSAVTPQEALIDAEGAVRFEGVPPGRYHVTVQCLGHLLASGPRVLDVDTRDRAGLLWTVERAAALTVEVRDAEGAPVPAAGLALLLPARGAARPSGRMPLVSDAAGRVTVPNLAPGRYAVVALNEPERPALPVLITPFDDARHLQLTLGSAGALRMTVRDAEGKPADDLHVSVRCDGTCAAESVRWARSLGAGVYVAQALPAGSYRVQVDDGTNPPRSEGPLAVAARGEVTLSITLPATGTLRGRVVDASGAGLANVWVQAAPEGTSHARGLRALSDVDGEFALQGLVASPTGQRVIARRVFGAEAVAERVQPGGPPVTLVLPEPIALRGLVHDAQGRPLPGARVWASSGPSGQKSVTSSGPDGRFVLRGLTPGPVRVLASHGAALADELSLALSAGEQAPLRIRVASADVLARAPAP